ncbi:MAG: M67 family metallopeptidase [Armatimonadota bacterium]|nr:MAG: M67 family metallopeptidase [Armatimonadota bacterium]
MVLIGKDTLQQIIADAERAYPAECCGILIGRREDVRVVTVAHPAANVSRDGRRDRYEIDPAEIHRVARETEGTAEQIIGFYHSHPGFPPHPSVHDAVKAWPYYSYLIVSIRNGGHNGGNIALRSWVWQNGKGEFREEPVEVTLASATAEAVS